jgi:hypothetical protein
MEKNHETGETDNTNQDLKHVPPYCMSNAFSLTCSNLSSWFEFA